MANKNDKRTNNDVQNIPQKTKDCNTLFGILFMYLVHVLWLEHNQNVCSPMCLHSVTQSNNFTWKDIVYCIADKPYTGRTVIRRLHIWEKQLLTFPEHLTSSTVFPRLWVAQSIGFCVVFCRSLSLFLLPLHGLSFLRLMVTRLVLSNSS
jgi:hypothetical protein